MKCSAPMLISLHIGYFVPSCTGLLRVWGDDKIYTVYIKESCLLHFDPVRLRKVLPCALVRSSTPRGSRRDKPFD